MAETIDVQKKPLFAQENKVEQKSPFHTKKKLLIVGGLILFIILVLGLMFYFLGQEYITQVVEKSS